MVRVCVKEDVIVKVLDAEGVVVSEPEKIVIQFAEHAPTDVTVRPDGFSVPVAYPVKLMTPAGIAEYTHVNVPEADAARFMDAGTGPLIQVSLSVPSFVRTSGVILSTADDASFCTSIVTVNGWFIRAAGGLKVMHVCIPA